MRDRGRLLWEYRPPRAHPILYAGLLCFLAVFLTGSVENLLRDNRAFLYAVYAAPVAAVLLLMLLLRPSPVRIHERGIAPSRPLLLRWRRPFVRWDDLAAVYPGSYDVTGAFVSPFASSDGKVTQSGLALEHGDGRVELVRFTPTRFAHNARRSRGYREAIEVVRDLFAAQGRAMVDPGDGLALPESTRARLRAEAQRPFLPFFAIVLLFASAAPVLLLLLWLRLPVTAALPLALLPPIGTSLLSWTRSRRRNAILNLLGRADEAQRAHRPGRSGAP